MDNPYLPTKAVIDGGGSAPEEAGLWFWLVALGSSLLSVCIGLYATFVIPAYAELYAGFGAELPVPTLLVMQHGLWLWLLSMPPIMVWAAWLRAPRENPRHRGFRLQFSVIALLNFAVLASMIWAMYLPFFHMSEAVQ